jgi:predicted AAA+ superfamily ATPase
MYIIYETDFVINLKTFIIPFQVTYILNESNVKREIKGITHFCKKFNLNIGIIINYSVEKIEIVDGIQIQYVKLLDFLLNSHDYLLDLFHNK